ncbi:transmembrane O-mannosyltransferase targeting cadherins 2 [Lycorma delicatula]|uniref:transmembrane O-mannosyltransferase targeting cadherins 2 n=1 Tax=Lycorma delicatula TaxID=130591 RepID=UPI003F513C69
MDVAGLASCALAYILYHNTLDAGFVYDDSRAVLSNPDVQWTTPLRDLWLDDFWGTPLNSASSHGSYRPLCTLSFRLNHWFCGFRPWGYHLVNVLLHVIATGLVYKTAKLLLPGIAPALASLLFAAHPVHTEAVAGVVGRADVLACVCYLLSFLCYAQHVSRRDASSWCTDQGRVWVSFAAAVALAAAAMLSKETGITVIGTCALYDILRARRLPSKKCRLTGSLALLGLSLCVLLLIRLIVMGPHSPTFAKSDNPTARSPSLLVRTLTFAYLPVFNLQLLLWPRWLSFDWSMDAIPRVSSIWDPRNIFSFLLYFIMGKVIFRALHKGRLCHKKIRLQRCPACRHCITMHHTQLCRANNNNNHTPRCECTSHNETLLLAVGFTVFPFLPASNLLFYVGFVVAERVLYLPSVGFCFLVAFGCHLLARQSDWKLVRLCFAILLLSFSARTLQRNRDWHDEEGLYRSGIIINPPKAWGNLGSVLSGQGRMQEAEDAFRTALKYRANMADVHYNLGILLQGREKYEDAISSYQLAIHYRPSLALAHLNLGQLLASRGRCQEAEAVLRRCAQLDGTGLKDPRTHENTRISALLHLGRLHADRGRYEEAVSVYREAIRTMPHHYPPQILYNLLGEALSKLHQHDEAERWYKAALSAKPDHVPAHLTYGKLLAKNRTRIVEAEQWFLKAQQLAPTDPTVYQHFGQFLSELERHSEAATQYLRAAELAPEQYDFVLSAATALRQAGRNQQAEALYRKAVALRPQEAASHSNLGAMLHLNGKYSEAASSYKEALRLQPHDPTTLNNLHKLRSLVARLGT